MPTKKTEPAAVDPADAALSFEAALAQVEICVRQIESGELPLAEALAAFRRSSSLLALAQQKLDGAQAEIQILEDGVLKSFLEDDSPDAALEDV